MSPRLRSVNARPLLDRPTPHNLSFSRSERRTDALPPASRLQICAVIGMAGTHCQLVRRYILSLFFPCSPRGLRKAPPFVPQSVSEALIDVIDGSTIKIDIGGGAQARTRGSCDAFSACFQAKNSASGTLLHFHFRSVFPHEARKIPPSMMLFHGFCST